MKTILFTLLIAVSATADYPRFLYALVGNQYMALGTREVEGRELLTPSGPKRLPVPVFSLHNGIVSTGMGNQSKVLGLEEKFLVIGSRSKVAPFKVQLDKKSKILGLFINQCSFSSRTIRDKFGYNNSTIRAKQCSMADLYLLTPIDILNNVLHPAYNITLPNVFP